MTIILLITTQRRVIMNIGHTMQNGKHSNYLLNHILYVYVVHVKQYPVCV